MTPEQLDRRVVATGAAVLTLQYHRTGWDEAQHARKLYELACAVGPQNVIEYATHFGDDTRWFGPTALELEAAKRAVERRAA